MRQLAISHQIFPELIIFLKVYSYAKTIGEMENLDEKMQEILEVTAVLHDIGIKVSEEKYQILVQAVIRKLKGQRLQEKY